MKYTAITHKTRGNFQSDFNRCEDWAMEVGKDNEVEWSILIYVQTGQPVNKYDRAYGVSSLSNKNDSHEN